MGRPFRSRGPGLVGSMGHPVPRPRDVSFAPVCSIRLPGELTSLLGKVIRLLRKVIRWLRQVMRLLRKITRLLGRIVRLLRKVTRLLGKVIRLPGKQVSERSQIRYLSREAPPD